MVDATTTFILAFWPLHKLHLLRTFLAFIASAAFLRLLRSLRYVRCVGRILRFTARRESGCLNDTVTSTPAAKSPMHGAPSYPPSQ